MNIFQSMLQRKAKQNNKENGFTIIELVIVLGVFTVIMLGLFSLYDNYYKVYNIQQATARVVSAAAFTASEFQTATRQASDVVSSHSFSGTTYTTDSDTLVLRLPAVSASGDVIESQYDYIVFYVDGTRLYTRTLAHAGSFRQSTTRQLSDTVTTTNFQYNNGDLSLVDSININILMSVAVKGVTMSHQLQQTLNLHNK